MSYNRFRTLPLFALVVIFAHACSGERSDREDTPSVLVTPLEEPAALIVSPSDGDTVPGPTVRIILSTRDIAIRPAGTDEPGTGHHHLFVNRGITPVGETIPAEEGIIHLGGGQAEHDLSNLAPGDYVVIAVLGDHLHVRLDVATDTVRFTVQR